MAGKLLLKVRCVAGPMSEATSLVPFSQAARKAPRTIPASSQVEASGHATASSEIHALGKLIRIDDEGICVWWTDEGDNHVNIELFCYGG